MPSGMKLDPTAMRAVLAALDPKSKTKALRRAIRVEAQGLRSLMVQSFRLQKGGGVKRWAPLSKATIALRRSDEMKQKGGRVKGTKALVATGQERKAIQVIPGHGDNWDELFIGIPRGTRRSGGGSLINIALIHEFGAVIRPSIKQKAWFWGAIRKSGTPQSRAMMGEQKQRGRSRGTTLWIIPPRPMIGPSTEVWSDGLDARIQAHLQATVTSMASKPR